MSTNENDLRGVAGRINFPRRWEAGRLLWLATRTTTGAVGLGLTGAGNRAVASTPPIANEDLRVLAGITDLDASLVTIKDASERAVWSNMDALIKHQFGKRDLSRNVLFYKPPFLLAANNQLIADAQGVGAENGGNLVFLCDPLEAEKSIVTIPENAWPFTLRLALSLAGVANERVTRTTVSNRKRHTLVWGASTDLSAISIRIRDAEGHWWMVDPIPIWAVCAFETGQVITQLWPRPYYIPPGGSLQVEVTNPAAGMEANGFIDFFSCAWEAR